MKHLLLTILLMGPTLASTAAPGRPPHHAAPTKVYICNGSNSYAYHSSSHCQGLEYCSTNAKPVMLVEAEKLGRRPCQRCHK